MQHPLLHMWQSSILLLLGLSGTLGLANSIASTAECSAAALTRTRTMPASATGTSDDAEVEEADLGFESAEPRGFRKRWAKQTLDLERSIFKEDLEYEPFQEFDATISTQKKIRMTVVDAKIPVVDSTVDELVEPQPSKPSSSSIAHGLERNALLGTEMNVFKYPWEKGRLAKIFGAGPLVKPPSLKLAPGGVNPVQVSLDVGLSGSVSAKSIVRSPVDDTAIFMQIVAKWRTL